MLLRTATFAMGTRFELVLEARERRHGTAAAEAALAIIEDCDARYSRFRSDSLVSRINRAAGSSWVRVDPQTFELLGRCLELRRETNGAFDVCVGTSMDRLREARLADAPSAPGRAGAFELDLASSSVRFSQASTAIDLGGIGKGQALDLAAASLAESGIECALLHGGTSSVIALGAPPSFPGGWRVDLGANFGGAVASLRQRSLSISAVRENRRDAPRGGGAPHLLDPESGFTLSSDARSAVALPGARDAEAWSTALLVLAARGHGLAHELAHLSLPPEFECLVTDPVHGDFAHAALGFGCPSLSAIDAGIRSR